MGKLEIVSLVLLFLLLAVCDAATYTYVVDTYGEGSEKAQNSYYYRFGKAVNDLVGSN